MVLSFGLFLPRIYGVEGVSVAMERGFVLTRTVKTASGMLSVVEVIKSFIYK